MSHLGARGSWKSQNTLLPPEGKHFRQSEALSLRKAVFPPRRIVPKITSYPVSLRMEFLGTVRDMNPGDGSPPKVSYERMGSGNELPKAAPRSAPPVQRRFSCRWFYRYGNNRPFGLGSYTTHCLDVSYHLFLPLSLRHFPFLSTEPRISYPHRPIRRGRLPFFATEGLMSFKRGEPPF